MPEREETTGNPQEEGGNAPVAAPAEARGKIQWDNKAFARPAVRRTLEVYEGCYFAVSSRFRYGEGQSYWALNLARQYGRCADDASAARENKNQSFRARQFSVLSAELSPQTDVCVRTLLPVSGVALSQMSAEDR